MDIIKSVMPQLPAFLFGILSGICISYITYLLDERKSKNERQRKGDAEILDRLLRILKKDGRDFIGNLRVYGVTGSYEGDVHIVIENFKYVCSQPEYNFSDKTLEKFKFELNNSMQDLGFYLHENSVHDEGTLHTRVVFPLQHETYKGKYSADDVKKILRTGHEIDKTIDKKTDTVLDNYTKLINAAKSIGLTIPTL